jgi:hypothetical protein
MTGDMTLVDRHAALGYINAGVTGVGDFIAHDHDGDGVIEITWLSDRERPTAEELANARWPDPLADLEIERAEIVNEAFDLVMSRLGSAPVAPVVEPEPPLLPAPDALMSDWGEVGAGTDDITGDMLLDAFEHDETETVAVVQTLSALRLKHLSEQLNVERARLDREHQATGVANPRSASIDRLLGLLTRRGEV